MNKGISMRLVLALVGVVAASVVLVAVLMATDTVLSIWSRLVEVAPWAVPVYLTVLVVFAAATLWFLVRLLVPVRRPEAKALSREELSERLQQADAAGISTAESARELAELEARRQSDTLYIAFYGEMSVGKTALIASLVPGAALLSSPVGGTTREITSWHWQMPNGRRSLKLVDLPGFAHDETSALAELAREEALRAHAVVYVTDGDMNRVQHQHLKALLELHKPTVLVVNKADHLREDERARIRQRLASTVGEAIPIVVTSAGGKEEVLLRGPDGAERRELRERPPQTAALVRALAEVLGDPVAVSDAAESAMLRLAQIKLEHAEADHRRRSADALVETYSRRAVVGALAAITPGSDLVIQGALATKLLHDLTRLYQLPLKSLDADRLLRLAGGRLRKTTTLVLAVAGNALKAFPGVGTVAGGLVHAVAYGMIFRSLGGAVATALAEERASDADAIAEDFVDRLGRIDSDQIMRLARLAVKEAGRLERTG